MARRKQPKGSRIHPGYPQVKDTNIDRRGMLVLLGAGAVSVLSGSCGGRDRNPGSMMPAQPEPLPAVDVPETAKLEKEAVAPSMNPENWLAYSKNSFPRHWGRRARGQVRIGSPDPSQQASDFTAYERLPIVDGRTAQMGDGRETTYTLKVVFRKTNLKPLLNGLEEKILSIVDKAIFRFLKSDEDFNKNNLNRMAEEVRQQVLVLLPKDGTDWEEDLGLRLYSAESSDFLPGDAGAWGTQSTK